MFHKYLNVKSYSNSMNQLKLKQQVHHTKIIWRLIGTKHLSVLMLFKQYKIIY